MNDINMMGVTSRSGQNYILFGLAGKEVPLPATDCYEPHTLFRHLAEHGCPIPGKAERDRIRDNISSVRFDNPPVPIAEHMGWNEDSFVLPDARAIGGTPPPMVALTPRIGAMRKGTLSAWQNQVAEPLVGQPLATFVLAMAFASPLLDIIRPEHNSVFVLVGEPGIGKSTLQQLAASVVGPPTHRASDPFVVSLPRLMGRNGGMLAEYRDLPLIVDHLAEYFAGASKAQHQQVLRLISSHLLTGAVDGCDSAIRTIALLSSTEPLLSALGANNNDHRSLSGKILTIPVPHSDRSVFGRPPTASEDNQAFVHRLIGAAELNYGTAFDRFITKLARRRGKNPLKLAADVRADLALFRKKVAVDQNDGAAVRVADTFGQIYAAGKLAKRYSCLPASMDVLAAAEYCYDLHCKRPSSQGTFIKRLKELCKEPHVARLDEDSQDVIAQANVIVGTCKGHSERWIRPEAIEVLFPDWQRLKNDPGVERLLVRDPSKPTTMRKAGPNGRHVSMYVFRKPAQKKVSSPV